MDVEGRLALAAVVALWRVNRRRRRFPWRLVRWTWPEFAAALDALDDWAGE